MALCKCGCGRTLKPARGYKPSVWFSDACRMRARRAGKLAGKGRARSVPVASVRIVPGDVGLVDRVKTLVAEQLDGGDDVAAAQGQLAVELAGLAAEGSVSACRELRLLLLEMRLATDPSFEGEVSQAVALEFLLASLGVDLFDGVEPASAPVPPGWRSTAEDGELLEYLGRRWYELRDAGDVEGVRDLERWTVFHSEQISTLRRMGRWSVWPESEASL